MSESLKNRIFVGLVEDNVDVSRKGKLRIRVKGVFDQIPVEHIPWASPQRSIDGRSFGIPGLGKLVNVIFPNGDLYSPEYLYSENYNSNLIKKLDSLEDDEYVNFVSLLHDHTTQIYKDDESLTFDYYFNQIKITKKKINLELKNNDQTINLGHDDADQDAVLGTNFFKWFDGFMDILMQPTSLVGNYGAPVTKLQLEQKISEYKILRPTFVSNNVKINDNHKIEQRLDREIETISKVNDDTLINGDDIFQESDKKEKNVKEEKTLGETVEEENEKEIKKTRDASAEMVQEEDIADDYLIVKGELEKNNAMADISPKDGPFVTNNENTSTVNGVTGIPDPYEAFFEDYTIDARKGTYKNKNDKREKANENKTVNATHQSPTYGSFSVTSVNEVEQLKSKGYTPGSFNSVSGDINSEPNVSSSNVDFSSDVSSFSDLDYTFKGLRQGLLRKRKKKVNKIVLHWTAGGGSYSGAFNTWNNGNKKNPTGYHIATPWLLESPVRSNSKAKSFDSDVDLYRFYDDVKYYTTHASNSKIDWCSTSIEICNYGPLTKRGNTYYTYMKNIKTGALYPFLKGNKYLNDYVYDHYGTWGDTFLGKKYFQKLTDKQLIKLKEWILAMADLHDIDVNASKPSGGYTKENFFDNTPRQAKDPNASGIFMHIHYKTEGKWDLPPQPELIDMLNSL